MIFHENQDTKGSKGDGSEYWDINVEPFFYILSSYLATLDEVFIYIHVSARYRRSNTSLVNYANSDVITELTSHFLASGIAPNKIGILTYYADQKLQHIQMLSEANRDEEGGHFYEVGSMESLTVDAYQGREIEVCILDVVAADLKGDSNYRERIEDEDEDEDIESPRGNTRMSAPVNDAHPLCCAVTRAKDVLVVVHQARALIAGSVKKNPRQHGFTMMLANAHRRGLIYDDGTHEETHPDAIKERDP